MMAGKSSLNSDASWPGLYEAQTRVLDHQRKLHRWSRTDPVRQFGDVFNLVYDPSTLAVAWERLATGVPAPLVSTW